VSCSRPGRARHAMTAAYAARFPPSRANVWRTVTNNRRRSVLALHIGSFPTARFSTGELGKRQLAARTAKAASGAPSALAETGRPKPTTMAATNKSLARIRKTRTGTQATKKS
jgi:hypothetical protein